tara:strand:+ start:276 stop:689 length:414 start_codon:yes stop_codon:yes gene_type:complete
MEELINELRINCEHDVANRLVELQQRTADLERKNAEVVSKLTELERERDELAVVFNKIRNEMWYGDSSATKFSTFVCEYLVSLPKTSLAEHDAKVIEKAAEELKYEQDLESHSNVYKYKELVDYEDLIDYANKIRND